MSNKQFATNLILQWLQWDFERLFAKGKLHVSSIFGLNCQIQPSNMNFFVVGIAVKSVQKNDKFERKAFERIVLCNEFNSCTDSL